MKKKVLILGISSFAGASFANYLLNNSKFQIIGTFNNKKKTSNSFFFRKK